MFDRNKWSGEWRKNHREILRDRQRKYREIYPEKEKETHHKYYLKHRKEILKKQEIWRMRNKKKLQIYEKGRRQEKLTYLKEREKELRFEAQKIVGRGKVECINCGCKDVRILEINHLGKNNEKKSGMQFYKSIISGKRPIKDLDLRCRVCNHAYFVEKKYGIEFNITPKN
jgi:hypothetical protein